MNPKSFSFLLLFFVSFNFQLFSQIIYVNVKATGTNDGTTWANAFTNLQQAINVADHQQVWVAKGQYLSISLKNDVAVYGGFSGIETSLSQRTKLVINNNPTYIGGGLGFSVLNYFTSQNPLNNSAILDGFILKDAFGASSFQGGGMLNVNASPTLSNLIFINNTDKEGCSAMNNQNNSAPIMNNIAVVKNLNGGICIDGTSSAVIKNSVFSENRGVFVNRPAIRSGNISTLIENCTFYNNTSGIFGMANVKNSIFWANTNVDLGNNSQDNSYSTKFNVSFSLLQFPNSLSNGIYNYDPIIFPNIASQNNIFAINPSFSDLTDTDGLDNIYGTADDGLIPTGCSIAINKSDPTVLTPLHDFIDATRVSIFDLGAYENNETINSNNNTISYSNLVITKNQPTSGSISYENGCNTMVAKITTNGSTTSANGNITAKVWIENNVPMYNGLPYVARHYEISPSQNPSTSTARVTLYFTQNEFDEYNKITSPFNYLPIDPSDVAGISHLKIVKYSGISSNGSGKMNSYLNGRIEVPNIVTSWNAALFAWEVSFDVTGFSGFFVQTIVSPLPVNLISFDGKSVENKNILNWVTTAESNFSHFEIEKSEDGSKFYFLEKVIGNRSYFEVNKYEFEDLNITNAQSYYKLKIIDVDGSYKYSKIISIKNKNEANKIGKFYPNPTSNNIINIAIESENISKCYLTAYDIYGKILKNEIRVLKFGINNIEFLLEGNSKIQFIKVENHGQTTIHKIIKF